MILKLIWLQLTIFNLKSAVGLDELLSTVVLYRHGDRAPLRPYALDPYQESYWPLGFGQLTNIGKNQVYALGQWLRNRYADFLPVTYNKKDIKILSSNVDRCLMSAQLALAGLYPPEGDQIWNENLKWQPIPVHTVPEKEDPILAQKKNCPKYQRLYQQLMEEEPFISTLQKYKLQMLQLAADSGNNITTLKQLQDLYNIVYIENIHKLILPEWTTSLLTEDIKDVCINTWTSYAYTPNLARLRSGPLIDLILSHFENFRNNAKDTPKFLMLSVHDTTIATLLTALKIFDDAWPNYASSVHFELRKGEDDEYVNIFYNNDVFLNLTLPYCNFDCNFEGFSRILEPIRVNVEEWDKECQDQSE